MLKPIHSTAVIYPNVQFGEGVLVAEYVLVGVPPGSSKPGEIPTTIGPGAFIRSHTVIYAGNVIGSGFQTGHGAMIRELNQIGDNVSIGSHSVVEHHVEILDRVRIHTGAFIPEYSLLEEEVWIGPHVTFTNALHPRCPKAKQCLRGPRIRKGAKIGAAAVILPDVEVGEYALVGAGAVVTHDVPSRAVVSGSPARFMRTIDELRCPYNLMPKPYSDSES